MAVRHGFRIHRVVYDGMRSCWRIASVSRTNVPVLLYYDCKALSD